MKTIGEILGRGDSPLAKLIKKAKSSQNLESLFYSMIDPALVNGCRFASMEGSEIFVTIINSSFATRFRYAIPDIIKTLRTQPEFKSVRSIRYSILAPVREPKQKRKQERLSQENESLWKETMASISKKAKEKKACKQK